MADFKDYVAVNIQLLRSMTIKSTVVSDKLNSYDNFRALNSVEENNLETQRYYLNVSGEYHPLDIPMYVISHDNLETILFSKQSLLEHPLTRKGYMPGTEYWYKLSKQYPNQERLINGILFPCDIQKAVTAPEWTILSYDPTLIEEQEITLLEDLQAWIMIHQDRWDKKVYNNTDSYFAAAQAVILYMNLLPTLLNMRLKRVGTIEAHSFHVNSYLASHSGLDKYTKFMTLYQKMYFYRNIRYLERNAGKTATFKKLIQTLLTHRFIPISEFTCRHDSLFNDDYSNTYKFKKKPLNTQYNIPAIDYFTLDEVLSKEISLAPGNSSFIDSEKKSIATQFSISDSSVVRTKDLESSMLDMTGSSPHPLMEILLSHWYLASMSSRLTAVVKFNNKVKGTSQVVSSSDAVILSNILTHRAAGDNLITIPSFQLSRVLRTPKVTKSELEIVGRGLGFNLKEVIDFMIPLIEDFPIMTSLYSFYEFSNRTFQAANQFWRFLSTVGDLDERAIVEKMIDRVYCDVRYELPETGYNVETWLREKNLDLTNITLDEYKLLTTTLVEAALGIDQKYTPTVANIQKAMIEVLTKMSSYSIQITADINTKPLLNFNWNATRFTKPVTRSTSELLIPITGDDYEIGSTTIMPYTTETDDVGVELKLLDENKYPLTTIVDTNTVVEFKDPTDRSVTLSLDNFAIKADGDFFDSRWPTDPKEALILQRITTVINNGDFNTGSLSSEYDGHFTAKPMPVVVNVETLIGQDFRLE